MDNVVKAIKFVESLVSTVEKCGQDGKITWRHLPEFLPLANDLYELINNKDGLMHELSAMKNNRSSFVKAVTIALPGIKF